MDIFTDVKRESFLTGSIFQCPAPVRPEKCVSLTQQGGQTLTALYSVLVTLVFVVFWKIVSMLVMYFAPALNKTVKRIRDTDEYIPISDLDKATYLEPRDIGLVGFWNSREPLEALLFMFGYFKRTRSRPRDWESDANGLGSRLLALAVTCTLAGYAASIFVAAQLVVGSVAPANPDAVYVPKLGRTDPADMMRIQALQAPATLRSLGSAEAAQNDHTMRDRVVLDFKQPQDGLPYRFTYSYEVTADDFGLQHWRDLKQEVTGQCKAEKSWFVEHNDKDGFDVYNPWSLNNKSVRVVYDGERQVAPRAEALVFPYKNADFLIDTPAEHRYGIIVHSSHRPSHRPGSDPWYETEPFTPPEHDEVAKSTNPPGYRVKGGRPALSCIQKDVWHYNGTRFKNIYELTDSSNTDFPEGWQYKLQMDFGVPRIIDIVNSAGASSLASSMTMVQGMFDAETATIATDMTRLFVATWIASSQTFRDMLMVIDPSIPNAASAGNGRPQDRVALFTVSTPKVATIRLSVLITIPTLLGFLVVVKAILAFWSKSSGTLWSDKMRFAEGAYLFWRMQELESELSKLQHQNKNKNPAETGGGGTTGMNIKIKKLQDIIDSCKK